MLAEKGQSSTHGKQFLDENCKDGENTRETRFSGSQSPDVAKDDLYSEGIVLENKVVKKWQDPTTRLKIQPVRNSGLPLILWPRCCVVDIISKDITLAENLNYGTRCLYTKGGWLLFWRFAISGSMADAGFFLQNVISGARIDLPDMRGYRSGKVVFSTFSSSPDLVVNVSCGYHPSLMTVHVIQPGDEEWTMYTTARDYRHEFYNAVIIKGSKVYCFDSSEEIAIFDLIDREWIFVSISLNDYACYVMEFDDEIVKMQPLYPDFKSYGFYKLQIYWEERQAAWVEMSREEWKGRSIFVDGNRAFSVMTERENLYRFVVPKNLHMVPKGKLAIGVEAIDLLENTSRNLLPFSLISDVNTPVWINLDD